MYLKTLKTRHGLRFLGLRIWIRVHTVVLEVGPANQNNFKEGYHVTTLIWVNF